MALISCPDCGTQVSDMAPACTKCGRPMSKKEIRNRPSALRRWGIVAAVLVVVAMAMRSEPDVPSKAAAAGPTSKPASADANPKPSPEEEKRNEQLMRAVIGAKSIKAAMREPESFNLEQVLAIDKTDAICYTYRAKNGFGGTNVENAVLEKGAKGLRSTGMNGFATAWNRGCGNKSGSDITRDVKVFL